MNSFQKQFRKMPHEIQQGACEVMGKIHEGESPRSLGCKYIKRCKSSTRLITAPLGTRYRLLLSHAGRDLVPLWIGSHEAYNKRLSQL
jgi:hypothetical protein